MKKNGISYAVLATASLAVAFAIPVRLVADPAPQCAVTQISTIRMPTGPARYQAGRMTLANGASLELSGAPNGEAMNMVSAMRVGDRVAACRGRMMSYADAGPSRTITILDLRNGQYYGTLIGTWQ
jgi:hypothetical protein